MLARDHPDVQGRRSRQPSLLQTGSCLFFISRLARKLGASEAHGCTLFRWVKLCHCDLTNGLNFGSMLPKAVMDVLFWYHTYCPDSSAGQLRLMAPSNGVKAVAFTSDHKMMFQVNLLGVGSGSAAQMTGLLSISMPFGTLLSCGMALWHQPGCINSSHRERKMVASGVLA